jgi:predicted nucleic acid-binding Zn ribbon protein
VTENVPSTTGYVYCPHCGADIDLSTQPIRQLPDMGRKERRGSWAALGWFVVAGLIVAMIVARSYGWTP